MRHARRPVVTAAVDSFHFLHPVHIGELIMLSSSVNRVFHSSMEVGVRVVTEKLLTGERLHTCSAYLTFVALDENSRPAAIPPVIPETEAEKRRYQQAGERREYRLAMRARLKAAPWSTTPASPSTRAATSAAAPQLFGIPEETSFQGGR